MNAEARSAVRTIRRCIAGGRFQLKAHFARRMDQRGMTWADVLAMVDSPADVRADGVDDFGRDRWIVSGEAMDGLTVELLCVFDRDEAGELVVFITLYWKG